MSRDVPAIHIYTAALCPYAQRVRLTLAEKRLAAAEIEIDPRNRPADFLALSPAGTVPLLVHGAVRLWDSAAVIQYLEEAFPAHPLLPKAPALRAAARISINFADSNLYEPTHRLLMSSDARLQAEIAERLATSLRFLDTHALAPHGGAYVLGEDFSLADIALFPWYEQLAVLERFRQFRLPAECDCLPTWREAVAQRRGVRSAARTPDFYLQGYAQLLARME